MRTEFPLLRFDGDAARADAVYRGMTPLRVEDVAECVRWVASMPSHVDVDSMLVLARDQVSAQAVHRV